MPKFRKKPVVIEAIQWTGDNIDEILQWIDFDNLPPDRHGHVNPGIGHITGLGVLEIPTLEGVMIASPSDWIICGVKGEYYPCKPDIFEETYEEVD